MALLLISTLRATPNKSSQSISTSVHYPFPGNGFITLSLWIYLLITNVFTGRLLILLQLLTSRGKPTDNWTALHSVKVKVKVTLRLAVYRQSVRRDVKSLETHDQRFFQLNSCGKRGKAIPVTDRRDPQGCERLRLPHYLDKRLIDGGKVVSPTRRPHLTPRFLFLRELLR
jgi:hypothetical protein